MSIKKEIDSLQTSWGSAYVISENTPDRLSGRIYEIIEAMGLTQKQEEATKNLIQKVIWNEVGDGIRISSERHSEIQKLYLEMRNHSELNNCSVSEI
jgi:hypothetical protein